MRAFSLGVFFALTLQAQLPFQNLAPNGDGTALYFSSPLRLKGTEQYAHPKIFVWEAGRGVRLYAQRPPTIGFVLATASSSSTPYNLLGASVSSDGNTVAITSISDCDWGTPCGTSVSRYSVELRRAGADASTYAGTASLSANGRFLLLGSAITFAFRPPPITLVDLNTGRVAEIENRSRPPYRHGVADDGAVVVSREGKFWLRSGQTGEEQPIRSEVNSPYPPKINGSATRLFYARYPMANTGEGLLAALDVASNSTRDLAPLSGAGAGPVFDISDDGGVAVCIEGGRAWLIRTVDSQRVQIGAFSGVATDLVLSGDGSKLFVVVGGSQILRFDLRTMAIEEIVPETPYHDVADTQPIQGLEDGYLGRGGAYQVEARDLPEVAGVRLAGRAVRLLSAGRDHVSFQVPWDAPEDIGRLELDLAVESRSPFQSAFIWPYVAGVRGYAPQWYRNGRLIAALHEDFSGPISAESPVRAGEIIHSYGSGFGPVSPQPELGEAAGSNPLSGTVDPVVCRVNQGGDSYPAEVVFAGLAPGWISLYQIDVRLPGALSASEAYLSCGVGDQFAAGLLQLR